MAEIGGLQGGAVDPGGRGIRLPAGDGAPVSGPGAGRPAGGRPGGIADGSLVDGLVTGKEGELYFVKVGSQILSARSSVPLFVGQRFKAVWDGSSSPPTLRLSHADMTVLARFSGKDQGVAAALLSRGMPVSEENVSELRRLWMKNGGDPSRLGALAELWARGAEITERGISLLAWYMGLSSEEASRIWNKIRERARGKKHASPKDLLDSLRGAGEDVSDFLEAHALAGRPARGGLDPASLLAPAWWPVDGEDTPSVARVAFARDEHGGREAWRASFDFDGRALGPVHGGMVANEKAMSVSMRLEGEEQAGRLRSALPELRLELSSAPLALQYLGVRVAGAQEGGWESPETYYGLDMEI